MFVCLWGLWSVYQCLSYLDEKTEWFQEGSYTPKMTPCQPLETVEKSFFYCSHSEFLFTMALGKNNYPLLHFNKRV